MSFSLVIEPEWNVIKRIKESIQNDASLRAQSKDFLEQTTLTAIELLENALKYSDSDSGKPVQFAFDVQDNVCRFSVTSYSKNPITKQALMSVIRTIDTGDPFDLYVKRLEKLKESPDGFSRMGLYRIAYEGEFTLKADVKDESVTIVASRPLEKV
ncbi:MAG: hypothetical protein JNM27_09285 [Leptospirales bacterium]|nr:hypothetical protein [Leptospirales bacterium]